MTKKNGNSYFSLLDETHLSHLSNFCSLNDLVKTRLRRMSGIVGSPSDVQTVPVLRRVDGVSTQRRCSNGSLVVLAARAATDLIRS